MKKTLMLIAIAALAAGSVFAPEGEDGQPKHQSKAWKQDNGGQPGWQDRENDNDQNRGPGDKQAWDRQDKRGGGDRPHGPMTPEEMEQMRATHEAIRDLAGAARLETDPAKKTELVAQLRTKLGEAADLMQAKQEKRLAQAEEHLADLKAKLEYAKANRETLLDEQVQRVLAGEKPMRPDRFKDFPNAKGGRPPPPPMGDDLDDDMPPPPAE
jgi:hypothetical protein